MELRLRFFELKSVVVDDIVVTERGKTVGGGRER
jgi:hypothetical protein